MSFNTANKTKSTTFDVCMWWMSRKKWQRKKKTNDSCWNVCVYVVTKPRLWSSDHKMMTFSDPFQQKKKPKKKYWSIWHLSIRIFALRVHVHVCVWYQPTNHHQQHRRRRCLYLFFIIQFCSTKKMKRSKVLPEKFVLFFLAMMMGYDIRVLFVLYVCVCMYQKSIYPTTTKKTITQNEKK